MYARLSEESEANRERATVETQMELLRKFAAEKDDMVVAKEYADISYIFTLNSSDTYTLVAECNNFIGEYKISVYKAD